MFGAHVSEIFLFFLAFISSSLFLLLYVLFGWYFHTEYTGLIVYILFRYYLYSQHYMLSFLEDDADT